MNTQRSRTLVAALVLKLVFTLRGLAAAASAVGTAIVREVTQ